MNNDLPSKFAICFSIYLTQDGFYVNGGLQIDQQSILKLPNELARKFKTRIDVEYKGINENGTAFFKFIRYSESLSNYTKCPAYILSILQNAVLYAIVVNDSDLLSENLKIDRGIEIIDQKRPAKHLATEEDDEYSPDAEYYDNIHQHTNDTNRQTFSMRSSAIVAIFIFLIIGVGYFAIKVHSETFEKENRKYIQEAERMELESKNQLAESWHNKSKIDSLVECKYKNSTGYLSSYSRDSSKLDRYQRAASLNKAASKKEFYDKIFINFILDRIPSLADISCSNGTKSDSAVCYADYTNSLINAHPTILHRAIMLFNRKVDKCLLNDSLNIQCGYMKIGNLFKASVDTPQRSRTAFALGRNLGTLAFLSQFYRKTWQAPRSDSIDSIGYNYCIDRYAKSKNACRMLVSGYVESQYNHSINSDIIARQVSKFAQLDSNSSDIQRLASWLYYTRDKNKSLRYAQIADSIEANRQSDHEESLKDDLRDQIEQESNE